MWHRKPLQIVMVVLAAALLVGGVFVFQRTGRKLPPEFVERLAAPTGRLNSLRTTLDGKSLIAGSSEGAVIVWDWTTRKPQVLEPSSSQPIVTLAESNDGLLVATGLQGQLRGWQLPEFSPLKLTSPEVPITAIAFRQTADGRSMLLGLSDGRIATLDGGKLTLRKSGHRGVKALWLSKDQDELVSVGTEGKVIWYNLKSKNLIATIAAHATEISTLLPFADSRFVTADWNGHIKAWDAKTRKVLWDAQQPDGVSGLAWLGERLVSAGWDGKLRAWSITPEQATLEVTVDTGRPIQGLAVIASDSLLATVSASREVEFWKLK